MIDISLQHGSIVFQDQVYAAELAKELLEQRLRERMNHTGGLEDITEDKYNQTMQIYHELMDDVLKTFHILQNEASV